MPDYKIKKLPEGDFVVENNCVPVLVVVDDMPLIILGDDVRKNFEEVNIIRVDILQLKCLKRLNQEEDQKT